jgi:hypothetical protein
MPMHCRPRDIIILFTLFMFMHASLQAQQVNVKASVDRTTILIGEQIKLNLEAMMPVGTGFKWFKTDTIPHFDIVDPGKLDSSIDANSKMYRQQLIITSFDSGYWTIPAFVLQSGRKRFRTDTFAINVTYAPYDTAKDYNDIKDIIPVKNPRNPYIPWIIAAVSLLALAGIIYFLRKKKTVPKPVAPPVSKLSPVDEAMESLEALRKEDLPKKGEVKQYYTRLNDILRWYVFRKFHFSSLEKTNDELVMQLRQTRLSQPDYTNLAQALRMADFVKFAKYTPSEADQEEVFQVIKNSISRLEASVPAT